MPCIDQAIAHWVAVPILQQKPHSNQNEPTISKRREYFLAIRNTTSITILALGSFSISVPSTSFRHHYVLLYVDRSWGTKKHRSTGEPDASIGGSPNPMIDLLDIQHQSNRTFVVKEVQERTGRTRTQQEVEILIGGKVRSSRPIQKARYELADKERSSTI